MVDGHSNMNCVPEAGKRNVLITSALPYVNNIPHLGNIVGSVLSGDVFARYCRLRSYNVMYICGTDEYGTATETKAIEEKCSPQDICDKYHKLHASIYEWFNLSFDYFGRTTTDKQTELTQDMFAKINANGYLFSKTTKQLYCQENCQRFLADRFVEGICPNCQYEDARGDQCDKCSRLIDALELKQPKCKVCKSEPIIKESEHLFLDLPKIEPKLSNWFNQTVSSSNLNKNTKQKSGDSIEKENGNDLEINNVGQDLENKLNLCNSGTHTNNSNWTQIAKSITNGWLKDGLKPRPITRDLKWGTKVPMKGYEDKVFYVWFDAPIGYLSISATCTPHWRKWWQPSDDNIKVELFQFLGKDNVPFHSIMFPATLLASGEQWNLVDHICAVDYLNYENSKFSKSRGVGVFGSDVKDTGIPADIWRFYLMFIRPEGQDSSFCWDDFKERVNSELLNNLGNFINRSLTFVAKNFESIVGDSAPNEEESINEDDEKLKQEIQRNLLDYIDKMEHAQLRDGLKPILSISRAGNQFIQSNKPWLLIKGTPEHVKRAKSVLYLACNAVALIALMLSPYMPQISDKIRTQLDMSIDKLVLDDTNKMPMLLSKTHKIGIPSPLFAKIENDQVKALKAKFSSKIDG